MCSTHVDITERITAAAESPTLLQRKGNGEGVLGIYLIITLEPVLNSNVCHKQNLLKLMTHMNKFCWNESLVSILPLNFPPQWVIFMCFYHSYIFTLSQVNFCFTQGTLWIGFVIKLCNILVIWKREWDTFEKHWK